jgi:Zn-dependent protease/predicted transcriptional regulator
MFRKGLRLPFRLAGIPLYLDISFLLILPLMVWLTARNLGVLIHESHLGLDMDPAVFTGLMPLALGLVSVIGLFASIVLHELGHSLTARRYGVKVRRITLWFLGGVAEFEEMPRQRGAEAIVGIAGPIVSFVLAAIFWGLTTVVPRSIPSIWIVVWYLGMVNLMLGLFNLLPALPLDGGRILRSLLALRMPHPKATLIAGNVSKVLAVMLGIWGLLSLNVWTVVLAFFIFTAVKSETQQGIVTDLLRGLYVGDLMTRDVQNVPAAMTAGQLSHYMLTERHLGFPVMDDQGRLVGTIGVEQLQNVHPETPIWQIMSTQLQTITERAGALDALTRMAKNGVDRLIVVDPSGQVIGIITKSDLMRAIQVRMVELQTANSGDAPPAAGYLTHPAGRFTPYPPAATFGYTPSSNAARDPQRYA